MKPATRKTSTAPVALGSDKLVSVNADRQSATVERLNSLLSNEFAIFTKTLNYHWNARGLNFAAVHEFLEEQYKQLLTVIDDVAERVREIDGKPVGTLQEMKNLSSISERPGVYPKTPEMIADLYNDHKAVEAQIKTMISDISADRDPGTEDFLTGLLTTHETMSWMLKSHIEKGKH